jgi:hypothetical protein
MIPGPPLAAVDLIVSKSNLHWISNQQLLGRWETALNAPKASPSSTSDLIEQSDDTIPTNPCLAHD